MENVVIKWAFEGNLLVNIVRVEGTVLNPRHNRFTSAVLLNETIEVMECAEKLGGKFIPFKEMPKKDGEFSCFEVVFKNEIILKSFIDSLKNGYS